MARREHGAAAEALEEIESAGDRLSEWLQENLRLVVAGVAGLLLVAGLGSYVASSRHTAEQEASSALARTRDDYLSAMGASPGAIEVPELANAEAAAQIRAEYEKRFGEVAAAHPGTVAGTLAALERARLASDGGRDEEAISLLEEALGDAPGGAVRGMLLQRIAQRLEVLERWDEAAARHEEAAKVGDYPLRGWAMLDAARCRAEAGDVAAAVALYDQLERELPDMKVPEDERARGLELRAAAAAAATAQ
jgi:predicted negative regulator of RcsB-dependent stress response